MRVLTFALVALWMAAPGAQSLGDVARKEAERRKTVAAPGKTYTNDTLKPEPLAPAPQPTTTAPPAGGSPTAGAPAPSTGTPSAGSKPGAQAGTEAGGAKPGGQAPAGAAPGGAVPAAAPAAKGEADWRARIQASRDALSRAQIFADALQSRINGLSADFTARDDPAQRAVVAADRQKSLDELERVKKEIQQHTKALADIQEEGRRAGVPAGWLR
jgi:hypothetical protein